MVCSSETISFTAALSLSTMAGSVFAGTNSPTQDSATKSLNPASTKVGTSGIATERSWPATARPLSLPSFTCAADPNDEATTSI